MSLVLKISYNDDIRRVSLEKTLSFDQLTTIVRNLFKFGTTSELVVKYEDDEKDLVTVASDLELREAITLATQAGHVLRLFVSEKSQASKVDKGKSQEPQPTQSPAFDANFVQFLSPDTILANLNISPDKLGDVLGLLQSFGCMQPGENKQPVEILKFVKNLVGSVPWLQDLLDATIKREESNKPPAPAESSNNNNNNNTSVHAGVACDGCQQTPIVGVRYKCAVCHNYDLCEKCEAKGIHDSAHPLVKIAQPRTFHHGRRFWGGRRCAPNGEQAPITHFGVTCDGCQQYPIVGQRFKCTVCPDYDLCEKCNAQGGVHDAAHPLESIATPRWRHPRVPMEGRRCPYRGREEPSESKLSAVFVQSVQTSDGTKVAPKTEFTKVWKVSNNGTTAWPENTVLSFVYGDRLESPPAVQLTSVVAPGQETDIAVTMTSPSSAGRFSNYWRLCSSDGTFFGPPLYTRIVVEEAASIIEQPVPAADPVVPLVPAVVLPPVPVIPEPIVVPAPVISEPVVPVPAPVPVETEEDKAVASLRSMGFTGDLVSALRRNGGDVAATVNYLLG